MKRPMRQGIAFSLLIAGLYVANAGSASPSCVPVEPEATLCAAGGVAYEPGQWYQPDPCNTCYCQDDGGWECTGFVCSIYEMIELHLETSGGFTGMGAGDVHIADWTASVTDPFHDPSSCTTLLQTEFLDLLLPAAEDVDWDAVAPSYRPPDNPHCCCDQIISELTVVLTDHAGESFAVSTAWCSQSLTDATFPADLRAFLNTVVEVGILIGEFCW